MAELIFIGTGSGKTSLKRYHSSLLFLTSNYNLLIDAGDGISRALLSKQIDINTINGILITHLHPDHYTGLASLLTQMKMNGRQTTLDIYINDKLVDIIKNFILQSYLFPEKLDFIVEYHSTYGNRLFKINKEISFLPRHNSHLESASRLKEYRSRSFSSSSLLISIGEINIQYTSDIGRIDDLHLFDDYNINILISEVTHIKPDMIVNEFESRDKLENIIFTHIGDENEVWIKNYISGLNKKQKEEIFLATDGLNIIL